MSQELVYGSINDCGLVVFGSVLIIHSSLLDCLNMASPLLRAVSVPGGSQACFCIDSTSQEAQRLLNPYSAFKYLVGGLVLVTALDLLWLTDFVSGSLGSVGFGGLYHRSCEIFLHQPWFHSFLTDLAKLTPTPLSPPDGGRGPNI